MKITFLLLALVVCAFTYEFAKPKNGTELEETLRSELDDIWVIEWYQPKKTSVDCSKATASNADCDCKAGAKPTDPPTCTPKAAPATPATPPANGANAQPASQNAQGGAAPQLTAQQINELNDNVLATIQKQCPSLSKEYKFIKANMDADLQ